VTGEFDASDSALARRAADGDERAFSVLVHRHKEGLYRLLRRYTGDADEAYEAAHEAFIAAWGALRRYDSNRPFGTWLRTIAINKARDRGRRMTVRRFIFGANPLDGPEAQAAADPANPADRTLIEDEQTRRLTQAISLLPPALRGPLLLTAFDGHSQQAAAEILRVSVKTIETRVYRAKKLLAASLGDEMRPSAR
jgi:RNA polymerase sigma factor (sigma-70 family)